MIGHAVLGTSVVLQFVAAFLALRLIRITGWQVAWAAIALAVAFMGVRRAITFSRLIFEEGSRTPDLSAELVALFISVLMVVGIATIAPIFRSIREVNETHRENDSYLDSLFSSMIDGLIVIDRLGAIQTFNPAAEKMFGYEAPEVIGQNVKILMAPAEREQHDSYLENYESTGESTIIGTNRTLLGQRRDGSTFPIELSVSGAEHGQTKVIVGVVRDISEHVQRAEILRLSEAALNNAQRMAHVGNWEWNILTGDLAWSDEIYRIFGRQPQEFGATYEAFLNTVHPDDRDAVAEAVNRAVAGDEDYDINHRIVLPDGEVRHVSEQGEVIRAQEGEPVHMSGVVLDITDRKQKDIYLETLFSSMIDGLVAIDKLGTVQSFNPAAEKMFGYEAQEVIGQNVKILMPPADQEVHDSYLKNYRSTGESTVIGIDRILLGQRKDGSTFPIELSISEAQHGQTKVIVGMVRDISERVQRAEIQQWLQLISDNAPINLGYLDTEPRYQFVNKGIENLYGLPQEEIVGKLASEIQGEDVFRSHLPRIEAVLRGEEVTFEQERITPDGEQQYYQSIYVPHIDDLGQVLGYYTLSIDITDRKKSEEQVSQLNRTLEQRVEQRTEELSETNQKLTSAMIDLKVAQNGMIQSEKLTALGTLLAGIAHEMNNPMMGIQNYIDYALRHSENTKVKEVLEKADKQVYRVTGIVSNMLRYSRPALETSSSIDVGRVVEDTLALTETELQDSEVSVKTKFPSTLPKAWARPDSLQQVLLNLVLNARDAMVECEDKRLEITGRHENGCVVVDVEDGGSGVPEALQERIFDPFFSTKPPGSGTGMGLAVSRQIIEGLNGTLVCENRAGQGAKFTITLPTHASVDRDVSVAESTVYNCTS